MKYCALFFLAAGLLLLGGCSNMPSQAVGPQGGGAPLPLNEQDSAPRNAALPERPMARRRRNAEQGRLSAPGDNMAGGPACPAWLDAAQQQEGRFMSYDCAAGAGANIAAPPLKFVPFAAQARNFAAVDKNGRLISRSGIFADWCLAQAGFAGLGPGAAAAEAWLNYGAPAAPCLGALMVAEERGHYCLAFCLGAVSLPLGPARTEPVYLGLGVKADGAEAGSRIGLVAFAGSHIAAFRLPLHYRPGKEQYRLDYTLRAEQFRAMIARRQAQQYMEQADRLPPAAAAAPLVAAAAPIAPLAPAAPLPNLPQNIAFSDIEQDLAAALERELAGQDFSAGDRFGGKSGLAAAAQPRSGAALYPAAPPAELQRHSPLRRYI